MSKKLFVICVALGFINQGCNQAEHTPIAESNVAHAFELTKATQLDVDNIAENLDVKYQLISNRQKDKCDEDKQDGLCFEAQLLLTANEDIFADQWQIYYSQIAPLHNFDSDEFTLEHINGDLHKISLTDKFSGFKKGETKTITFRAAYWSLSESDIMPNYIVTAEGVNAKVITSTQAVVDPETGLESVPYVATYTDYEHHFKRTADDKTPWKTSADFYQSNAALGEDLLDVSNVIIPTPKSIIVAEQAGKLDLSQGLAISYHHISKPSVAAALARLASFGVKESLQGIKVNLAVKANKERAKGSYQLVINEQGILITGVDENGVFNGLQSLASLLALDDLHVRYLKIDDEPLFEFRGMLVDTSRNFRSKAFILKLLDQMAAYKLNKLHLHMGDDEGWRLEIPGLPELTNVGSKRCFDLSENNCLMPQLGAGVDPETSVNGFYSVADYSEILQAASARYIQVLPSLDMPGHSRAAIKAMEARYHKYSQLEDKEKAEQYLLHDPNDLTQYASVQFYGDNTINVCRESSFNFVKKVMQEVQKIHQQAGQPLTRYHIGADETAGAWLASDICKAFIANNEYGVTDMKELGAYFVERIANMISDMGIEPAAWSDGLEHTRKENMPSVVQANAWDHLPWGAHHKVNELANRNWQVVISTPDVTYFDFPYEADPKEHGYYWASRRTNTEKVFQFMPENLPVHAEFWLDRQDNAFVADDRLQKDDSGSIKHQPLAKDRKFLGLQGQLWGENLRTDEMAEHKIFPRMIALAERAWYQPQWAVPYNYDGFKYSKATNTFTSEKQQQRDQQWQLFANTIGQKELPKLELAGISYRLPTVGAKIENGKLFANSTFPGLAIEFQEQGGEWQPYQAPVMVNGDVFVRTVTHNGERRSRKVLVE